MSEEVKLLNGLLDDQLKNNRPSLLKKCICELVGTAFMILAGLGCLCVNFYLNGTQSPAFQFSMSVFLDIIFFSDISGAHFNPAVTLAFILVRNEDLSLMIPYLISQVIGAIIGTSIIFLYLSGVIEKYENDNNIDRNESSGEDSITPFRLYWKDGMNCGNAFVSEFCGTFLLCFIVFATTKDINMSSKELLKQAPLFISIGLAIIITIFGEETGGFNPARDLGPRIVAVIAGWNIDTCFDGFWVFMIAPMIGGPLGAIAADRWLPSLRKI